MPETTMPETVVDEPGIADSPIASIDPKDAARAMAVEAAEDENGVGEFVEAIDAGDGITDYRFVSLMRGYEGWQWSVMMFHDVERDTWTVNESTLIPMEQALRPPEWIPWKDRLLPTDLSVTDSIGTDPDDPRLEEGFRRPPKPRPVTLAFRMHGTWKRPGPRARSMPRMRHRIPEHRILRRPTANLWSPRTLSPPQLRRMSMTR